MEDAARRYNRNNKVFIITPQHIDHPKQGNRPSSAWLSVHPYHVWENMFRLSESSGLSMPKSSRSASTDQASTGRSRRLYSLVVRTRRNKSNQGKSKAHGRHRSTVILRTKLTAGNAVTPSPFHLAQLLHSTARASKQIRLQLSSHAGTEKFLRHRDQQTTSKPARTYLQTNTANQAKQATRIRKASNRRSWSSHGRRHSLSSTKPKVINAERSDAGADADAAYR